MIQEYLFTTEEYRAEVECFTVPSMIQKEITNIENSSCWTLCLSIDSESEEAAKLLDPLNTQIYERYKPTILSNECSAYFNKSLFPIVNEFERKLRKLLYLASALQGDNGAHKVIIDLESKDLGEIFVTLFSDSNFVKCVKEKINQKTWQFTRDELFTLIKKLDENTLWDTLLGCDCAETLRKQFGELRAYRNDVMHARNINLMHYRSAKRLFQKVNVELDDAIGKLIGAKEENETITPVDFNSTLGSALSSIQSQIDTSGLYAASEMLKDIASIQPIISPGALKSLSEIGKFSMGEYKLKPELAETIANLGKIAQLKNDILPATSALRELADQVATYKIEMPPAIIELQRSLSEINMGSLLEDDDSISRDDENESDE